MRLSPLSFATVSIAALLVSAGTAVAAPCYVILDRDDSVVYRDYKPPFDMSNYNSPERALLRRKGQHLIVAEFGDDCNPVGYISSSTGASTGTTVDEIVGGVRSAVASSVATTGSTKAAPQPGSKAPAN
ncbi:MAG: hypothetical protein U1F54_14460 [Burkholderiales bacterium]